MLLTRQINWPPLNRPVVCMTNNRALGKCWCKLAKTLMATSNGEWRRNHRTFFSKLNISNLESRQNPTDELLTYYIIADSIAGVVVLFLIWIWTKPYLYLADDILSLLVNCVTTFQEKCSTTVHNVLKI